MRSPTPDTQAFAWYRAALAAKLDRFSGEEPPPIHDGDPQCGFYKRRFTAGAVFVPARIWLRQVIDQDGELIEPELILCEIGGDQFDAEEVWQELAGEPISPSEFQHMMKVRAWASIWRRDQPEAQPTAPVNLLTVQPPKWQTKRK